VTLDGYFDDLLARSVDLGEHRLAVLEQRVLSVREVLRRDPVLGPSVRAVTPHGSWAQRTIVKPAPGCAFGADVLVRLDAHEPWTDHPTRYLDELDRALGRSRTHAYRGRRRTARCVRLVYTGSVPCHVDLVPYVELADGRTVVVNRDTDDWEVTAPDASTMWLRRQDAMAGGHLLPVVRLLKYLRDHRVGYQGTRSVVLTALAGAQVTEHRATLEPGYYGSVPVALRHIVDDLDGWLQAHTSRPSVPDPSGSGLTFDHRWDDATFVHLRERIHMYAEKIGAACDDPDEDTSVVLWQDVFGPDFATAAPGARPAPRHGALTP
jgi:hypothetical protein